MSELPANRFGSTASAGLEEGVFAVLEVRGINSVGEQNFSRHGETRIWIRFADGLLNDLIADISNPEEPYLRILNLKATPEGYVSIETRISKFATEAKVQEDYAANIKISQPEMLDYIQQSRILEVLDGLDYMTDEDSIDRELEQILDQSYDAENLARPSLWQRKLKTAKFFGKTALMMLGAQSPYYAILPVHLR